MIHAVMKKAQETDGDQTPESIINPSTYPVWLLTQFWHVTAKWTSAWDLPMRELERQDCSHGTWRPKQPTARTPRGAAEQDCILALTPSFLSRHLSALPLGSRRLQGSQLPPFSVPLITPLLAPDVPCPPSCLMLQPSCSELHSICILHVTCFPCSFPESPSWLHMRKPGPGLDNVLISILITELFSFHPHPHPPVLILFLLKYFTDRACCSNHFLYFPKPFTSGEPHHSTAWIKQARFYTLGASVDPHWVTDIWDFETRPYEGLHSSFGASSST